MSNAKTMTPESIRKLDKVSQIPNFPYGSYEELRSASNNNEVKIGAAMDLARQWASEGGGAKAFNRFYLVVLSSAFVVGPMTLTVYALVTSNFSLLIYVVPIFLSFLLLRPMAIRAVPFFKLVTWIGYGIILAYLFGILGQWALLAGMTIVIPWLINRHIYKYSVHLAISAGLRDEDTFVHLFKYNCLALNYPNGQMVWGSDLIRKEED